MTPSNIPEQAVRLILFQRTEYLLFANNAVVRWLQKKLKWPSYNSLVALEAKLGPSRVRRKFVDDIESEYESIRDYLPSSCEALLDIGCGVAGIDVYINQHYSDAPPCIYLLDKTSVNAQVYYQFNKNGAFYNSLETARDLLINCSVEAERINLIEAAEDSSQTDFPLQQADLVISLISWGFHYPIETYLEKVRKTLSPQGRLILDIRKGTEGFDLLAPCFNEHIVIQDTTKYQRVCFKNKRQ